MRDERILDYNFVMNPFQETFKIFVEKILGYKNYMDTGVALYCFSGYLIFVESLTKYIVTTAWGVFYVIGNLVSCDLTRIWDGYPLYPLLIHSFY